jgi:hypothetical protein
MIELVELVEDLERGRLIRRRLAELKRIDWLLHCRLLTGQIGCPVCPVQENVSSMSNKYKT